MSEALFQQQGAPYADFRAQGTHYEGPIIRTGQVQSRKFVPPHQRAAGKQGELEFWPDGKPKMTAIITIQTTLRDPSIEGDDGQRSLWIKGKSMTDSVKDAIKRAGAARRGMEVGGWLSMTFTHETEPEFDGGSPTKHYKVEYMPPEESPQDNINIVGQANTSTQVAQPVQQPVAAGNGGSGTYAQPQAAPAQTTMDLSALSPEARAAVEAMLAQQGAQQ